VFAGAYRDLDDELNRRAWRDTLPRFALRPAAFDRARYDRFGRFLRARGLLPVVPPVDTLAVEIRRPTEP
jgi:putative hydroxymethylpyrimidine transport system substrate-binding protein